MSARCRAGDWPELTGQRGDCPNEGTHLEVWFAEQAEVWMCDEHQPAAAAAEPPPVVQVPAPAPVPPTPLELCRCRHLAAEHKYAAAGGVVCLGRGWIEAPGSPQPACDCHGFEAVALPLAGFRR